MTNTKSKRNTSSKKKGTYHRNMIHTKSLVPYSKNAFTIPDYKIYHKPSNASIVMNIKEGQSVYANSGLMVWMDDQLKVETQTRGFWKGLKRAFLSSDSFFLTSYSGTSKEGNKICFAPMMTGDIIEIKIKPGEKKLVASMGVVCCTENIILDTKMKLKGIFVSQAPFLSELSVPHDSKNYGLAWIAAYGGIETINVKPGQLIKIDNGHFLSCDGNIDYSIGTVGGLKSTFFSGEGLVMNFRGPCVLHIQNRNYHTLLRWILSHIPHRK